MKRETRLTILSAILAVTFLIVMLCACDEKAAVDTATETTTTTQATTTTTTTMTVAPTTAAQNDDFEIPPYDGRASVPVNGNVPVFDESRKTTESFERGYVLNTNSMKFHYPSCSSVEKIAEHNKQVVTTSREELMKQGYEPCGNCEP